MDQSVTFARHMARLIWLLLNEPGNIDEQKSSLRALVTISSEGPITLTSSASGLTVNGHSVSDSTSGSAEVVMRLAVHGSSGMSISIGATPADLLDAARLLASDPVPGESSADRLRATGARTVHLVPSSSVDRHRLEGFELVSDEAIATAIAPRRARPDEPGMAAPETSATSGLFSQFAAVPAVGAWEALLLELDTVTPPALPGVLDRIAVAAEQAQRTGDARALTTLLASVIRHEARAPAESRRDYALALRRIVSASGLRMLAAQLPRRAAPREDVELVLTRTGAEGADAVIEQLTQAQSAGDRRAYFDMLLLLRAGIPALIHMLGDARWYVVRNAVELLGEMQVVEAEKSIVALFSHDDERVRASATSALLRFDTPSARAAVQKALHSESPAVRQQAIAALGMRSPSHAAATLVRALEREKDESVQRAIYIALGRVASQDAVQRLVHAAQPATGLFARKSPGLRAAAVQALGEARTPEALAALRALADDKDREVREAVQRALTNARSGNLGVTGLFERKPRG